LCHKTYLLLDGDGNWVAETIYGVTTCFPSASLRTGSGNYYELTGSTVTKYYFAGTQRVATPALAPGASVRKYTIPQSMTVEYFLGDHLGSTSLTTDANGAKVSELRYKPCPLRYTSGVLRKGEHRHTWTSAPATTPAYKLPNYTFTGQYSYMDDPSTAAVTEGFGLMFYNARWYDPALGRFTQPDSLIPEQSQGAQAWDRYAYVNNNPVRYNDPSGHWPEWLSYITGALTQYIDDNLFGAFYAAFGANADTIANPTFQKGRELGRAISTTQAIVEVTIGAAMIEAAASSIPPTTGGGLACAAVSGGTCAVPTGLVVTGEAVLGVEGMLLAGHGGVMLARAGSDPLTNKRRGDALRDEIADIFEQNGYIVRKEVVKKTPFGTRRIDIEVISQEGEVLGGIETKVGNSRYLPSQRAKDAWLKLQGYIVNLLRIK